MDHDPALLGSPNSTPGSGASTPTFTAATPTTRAGARRSPQSPTTPTTRPSSSHSTRIDDEQSPDSGSAGNRTGKRKRSRVNPAQLTQLELVFSKDKSPTAARRKEISVMLGMAERQTQIWFQNRRAKAKLLESKAKARGLHTGSSNDASATSPPATPPELSVGTDGELGSLLDERDPISIIPCTDLSIGSWRRISSTAGLHDLVAYTCESKRTLTWFILSAGSGFKMEIPYDSITAKEFRNAAPGQGRARFTLDRKPLFFRQIPTSGVPGSQIWQPCDDWTEGRQASSVLYHEIIGSAMQLAHALQTLPGTSSSSSPLVSPDASIGMFTSPSSSLHRPLSTSPVLIQPPVLPEHTGGRDISSFEQSMGPPHVSHLTHGRKRSFSTPETYDHSYSQPYPMPHSAGPTIPEEPFAQQQQQYRRQSMGYYGSSGSTYTDASSYAANLHDGSASTHPFAREPSPGSTMTRFGHEHSHSTQSLEDAIIIPISHLSSTNPYSSASDVSPSFGPSMHHSQMQQMLPHPSHSPLQFSDIPPPHSSFDPSSRSGSASSSDVHMNASSTPLGDMDFPRNYTQHRPSSLSYPDHAPSQNPHMPATYDELSLQAHPDRGSLSP